MKAVITGSTGMVGGILLDLCLNSEEITEVISFVRKSRNAPSHPKLEEIVLGNFEDYSKHYAKFQNAAIGFFCLGVYTGQVADEMFKKITVDYAVIFATALKQNSKNATLCLLSGAGADRTEKSKTSFAKYKGMAENRISDLGLNFYAFRPAYIYPSTPRKEPNLMYQITRLFYPLIKLFGTKMSIKSTELAQAMFQVGINKTDKEILENKDIINLLKINNKQ